MLFKVVFAFLKHHEKLSSDLAAGPTGSHADQQNLINQANYTCPVQGLGEIPTKQVIRAKRLRSDQSHQAEKRAKGREAIWDSYSQTLPFYVQQTSGIVL